MISNAEKNKRTRLENLSTRNAVETAIDLSKSDKTSTWDEIALRMRKLLKPGGERSVRQTLIERVRQAIEAAEAAGGKR